jgi:hypothetical protein
MDAAAIMSIERRGERGQEMMAPRKSLYVYAIYVHTDRRERHRQTGTGGDHVFYFPGPVTLNCFIVPLLDHVQLSIQPSLAALRTKPYPGFIQTSNPIFFWTVCIYCVAGGGYQTLGFL